MGAYHVGIGMVKEGEGSLGESSRIQTSSFPTGLSRVASHLGKGFHLRHDRGHVGDLELRHKMRYAAVLSCIIYPGLQGVDNSMSPVA